MAWFILHTGKDTPATPVCAAAITVLHLIAARGTLTRTGARQDHNTYCLYVYASCAFLATGILIQ